MCDEPVCEEWAGTQSSAVEVHEFIDRCSHGMIRESRVMTVFPTESPEQGVIATPERLKHDLDVEFERVE